MSKTPIWIQYIDFIQNFGQSESNHFEQELESLFSTDVQKVVNSTVICANREQLLKQMLDVKNTYGFEKLDVFESIVSMDNKVDIIRWEISYKDDSTESVITFLKYDDDGFIEEINEVFGEKGNYQWNS